MYVDNTASKNVLNMQIFQKNAKKIVKYIKNY